MNVITPVAFTAHDRCDACGAQARMLASRTDTPAPLMFCGHHGAEHADALTLAGWDIMNAPD